MLPELRALIETNRDTLTSDALGLCGLLVTILAVLSLPALA